MPEEGRKEPLPPKINKNFDDRAYIVYSQYAYGDVRRYGIFPETKVSQENLENLLDLAERGVPLTVPSGYYPIGLRLVGKENISIRFENVILGGPLDIIEAENLRSSRIALTGNLSLLDRIFIRHSGNISIDSLVVYSNTEKNIYGKKNRGVSIYAGSRNIDINYLEVIDTGGEPDRHYQYSAAAVQIYGWNHNPQNVHIPTLKIKDAGRSGLYITGIGHRIEKLEVLGYGTGSSSELARLEDAPEGTEASYAGIWINKCDNCEFDSVRIANKASIDIFDLRLGPGEAFKPAIINSILTEGDPDRLKLQDSELTNVIIKKVMKDEAEP